MNSELRAIAWGLLLLGAGGSGLQLWPRGERAPPTLAPGDATVLAANACWLRANLAWEAKNEEATRRYLRLSVLADPTEEYFWRNGARLIAFDFPAWRVAADPEAPASVRQGWRQRAVREAVDFLEPARVRWREPAALEIELATLWLYGAGDREKAARHFRRAAQDPLAPEYAGRLAKLLQAPE